MSAFRASPRVVRWSLAACLLGGCGRFGFEEVLLHASPNDSGGSPERDAGGLKPGEAPNEPVPVEPVPTLPPADGGADDAEAPLPEDDAGSNTDAGTPPDLDAAVPPGDAGTRPDAGSPADAGSPPDAGSPDAGSPDAGTKPDGGTPDAGPRACEGVLYENVCWYLSGNGETCNDVCRAHGDFDTRSASIVGSLQQGGSAANCTAIFRALGFRNTVTAGMRTDGVGLGCHRWDDGGLWWLQQPDFQRDASSPHASRICGCAK